MGSSLTSVFYTEQDSDHPYLLKLIPPTDAEDGFSHAQDYLVVNLRKWAIPKPWYRSRAETFIQFSTRHLLSNAEWGEQRAIISHGFGAELTGREREMVHYGLNRSFGPAPFRGVIDLEIGLFSLPAESSVERVLGVLDAISAQASIPFVSTALPFARLLKQSVDNLFELKNGKRFHIGLSESITSKTKPGIYVLMDAAKLKDQESAFLDTRNYLLMNEAGEKLNCAPYIVYEIENLARRPDWFAAPDLVLPWRDVRTAGQANDVTAFEQAIGRFKRACLTSLDILPPQARELGEMAEHIRKASANSFYGFESRSASDVGGFDPGPLDAYAQVTKKVESSPPSPDAKYETAYARPLISMGEFVADVLAQNSQKLDSIGEHTEPLWQQEEDQSFSRALNFVGKWEGGFSDHPDDRGGRTNFGITQATYDRWRAKKGRPEADVKSIEHSEARDIYFEDYWCSAHCNEWRAPLALLVFDTAVNMGVKRSIRMLQRVVGVAEDGLVGPNTLATVREKTSASEGLLAIGLSLIKERERLYRKFAANTPSQRTFLKGWINRVRDLRREFEAWAGGSETGAFERFEPDIQAEPTPRIRDLSPDQPLETGLTEDAYERMLQAPEIDLDVVGERFLDVEAQDNLSKQIASAIGLAGDIAQSNHGNVDELTEKLLNQLRGEALYESLYAASSTFETANIHVSFARRMKAQALIEMGLYPEALDVLSQIKQDHLSPFSEVLEARGLTGRVYKQLYVNSNSIDRRQDDDETQPQTKAAPPTAANPEYLNKAFEAYYSAYLDHGEQALWHGLQAAALLHRAQMDGVTINTELNPEQLAVTIADISKQKLSTSEGRTKVWLHANIANCSAMLGDYEQAALHLNAMSEAGATKFQLAGTARQFREILLLEDREFNEQHLSADHYEGLQRLVLAQTRLNSVSVSLGDAEYRAMINVTSNKDAYEKVFNRDFYPEFDWVERFLEISRSIVEIRSSQKTFYGTGFLVEGGKINPDWEDLAVIMTNEHVVSTLDSPKGALRPGGARVRFTRCSTSALIPHKLSSLWCSSRMHHDVTFLTLPKESLPADAVPLRVDQGELLPLNQQQKVTVIGHPQGRKLSLAIENLTILDHNLQVGAESSSPTRIQYQSATEPGSSGSPIFDWYSQELIGIHHMGGALDTLQNGAIERTLRRPGTREKMRQPDLYNNGGKKISANQGVAIGSIIRAVREHPNGYEAN